MNEYIKSLKKLENTNYLTLDYKICKYNIGTNVGIIEDNIFKYNIIDKLVNTNVINKNFDKNDEDFIKIYFPKDIYFKNIDYNCSLFVTDNDIEIDNPNLIICNSKEYKLINQYNIKWERVIFDSDINIPKNKSIQTKFFWFIESHPEKLIKHKNYGFIRSTFKYLHNLMGQNLFNSIFIKCNIIPNISIKNIQNKIVKNKILNNNTCDICYIDHNSIYTLCCYNSICRDCTNTWKHMNSTCPFCRKNNLNVINIVR